MMAKYFVAKAVIVKKYPDGREVCNDKTREGRELYTRRLVNMCVRQQYRCAICNGYIESFTASFDHQDGRGSGGGHRDDRIEVDGKWKNAALCIPCNGLKGSRRYSWQGNKYLPVSK